MILRILFLLCLAGNLWGGDFFEKWKPGHTETLKYEIKTILPKETISYQSIEISREVENENILNIYLKLDMPANSIIIRSVEKYNIQEMKLIESLNYFKLPSSAIEQLGTDSIAHKAYTRGDSLVIAAKNNKLVTPGTLHFPASTVTTTASAILSRNNDFKIGKSQNYKFINLLKLNGQAFQLSEITDSISAIVEIETPLGKMECYQVMNIVAGGFGYTYFTTDERHLPVKVELMNPEKPTEPTMTVLLTEIN